MGELSNTTINGVSYDFKDAGAARQSHSHTKSQITDFPTSMPASDVAAWAKASTKPTYTASEVGAIATTEKGAANGVASLDSTGKVPSSQLPSYVDDVLEYSAKSSFPTTGESGKIYVDTSNNKTYRWSGSAYVEISESLALGETSSTAYRGDRGKTAYDHSQVTSGNPHNVTKTDVGLSNVGNFKAVSTVASQGLSSTEQANARANIGAGTSSFSGSYSDLSNRPTLGTAAAKDVPSSGNASTSQVVMGNDSRLSDARTPTSHTHTKSQITDFPTSMTPASHTHGNIQNGGTLQTNDITIASGDKLVVTDASNSNKVARASISFDGSTTTQALTKKGTFESFAGLYHTHGSINHDGTLNTTPIGISNGDRLLITSASDNNLICTGVEFDGSTTTQALTKKGTFIKFQAPITASAKLSSDYVDDTNKAHRFATSAQLAQIATNQAALAEVINTSGKNIFPPSNFQATGSIFYITKNDDGTYLVKGGYAYNAYTFVTFTVPNSGTYVLSGCPSGGSTTNGCYLQLRKGDDTVIADSTDIGSGSAPFYIEAGKYKMCICVQNYNFPSSGSVFKPMLCLSSEFNISNDFVKYDIMSRWYYSDLNYTSNTANTMEYCGVNFTVPAEEIYEFYVTDGDGNANPTGIGVCDSSSNYGSNSTIIAENMDSQSTYSSNVRLWTRQVSGITVPYSTDITYYVWVKRSTAAQAKVRLLLKRIK